MKERDKFLTEAMGQCYHDPLGGMTPLRTHCSKCDTPLPIFNPNFSTWQGFGLLWSWVLSQEWYWHFDCHLMYAPSGHEFTKNDSDGYLHKDYIHPDKFADAVYEYLKNKN